MLGVALQLWNSRTITKSMGGHPIRQPSMKQEASRHLRERENARGIRSLAQNWLAAVVRHQIEGTVAVLCPWARAANDHRRDRSRLRIIAWRRGHSRSYNQQLEMDQANLCQRRATQARGLARISQIPWRPAEESLGLFWVGWPPTRGSQKITTSGQI
jgi:hypothetical protein